MSVRRAWQRTGWAEQLDAVRRTQDLSLRRTYLVSLLAPLATGVRAWTLGWDGSLAPARLQSHRGVHDGEQTSRLGLDSTRQACGTPLGPKPAPPAAKRVTGLDSLPTKKLVSPSRDNPSFVVGTDAGAAGGTVPGPGTAVRRSKAGRSDPAWRTGFTSATSARTSAAPRLASIVLGTKLSLSTH